MNFTDLMAIAAIMIWPAVPLFWIPVHSLSKVFKRIGLLTYIMPVLLWAPLAYAIFSHRAFLLGFRLDLPVVVNLAGIVLLISGTLLHIWTGKLLTLWGLMGLPEITDRVKSRFVAEGAFSFVRHPTYLAHTVMFSGVFFITGVLAAGITAVLDIVLINLVVIPLEEKELLDRFGREYEEYRKRVPRFFPLNYLKLKMTQKTF